MRKDNAESIYPLSPVQQGILFHTTVDRRSGVYVEVRHFSIRGDLDVEVFRSAWRKVAARHAVFRTAFVLREVDTSLQMVHKHVDLPWMQYDWSAASEIEQREWMRSFLKSEQERGFDLAKAPLQRLTLIRLAPDLYHFIFSFHHIVLDGWSVRLVLDEVFVHYTALLDGHDAQVSKPQPYEMYVNWLREQDSLSAEMYWREKLYGFSRPTPLGVDEATVGGEHTAAYDTQQSAFSKDTSVALQALARENKLTLNTVFQGAWALLLGRYSGDNDVIFGSAVSGRSIQLTGIESMVGLFIATLPVRVKISPQVALVSWLQKLQEQQVQARQFEHSSLRDIQAWSGLDRARGKTLFDSILSFNNYAFEGFPREKTGNVEFRNESFQEGSHYPLTVLIDPGDEIRVRIKHDCNRFDGAAIRRMLEHLHVLLEEMVADPRKTLAEFSLLTEREKQQLIIDFNASDRALTSAKSVVELFEEQVRKTPGAIALRHGDQTFTYEQLNRNANQLARFLQQKGIGPEDVAALCLDRSPFAIIAILGVLKAGGGYLPLDASLPVKRLELMLEETNAPLVLTTRQLAGRLPDTKTLAFQIDTEWAAIESESGDNIGFAPEPDSTAYIIYTSGSTGRPKGAVLCHRNVLNYVAWAREYYLRGEALDFPLFSALSFDLTVTSIFVPLISGGSIVVYGESETANLEVLDVIRDNLVDIIKLTPAHLALIQAAGLRASRLRKMIVGGEDFKRSLAQGIWELFGGEIEIYNEYGPTEATVGCMIHRFDPETDTALSVPIGRPISNAQVYLLDQNLRPVPTGVVGEMCIGGIGVARGYLQRPDLTATKFVEHPFQPGTLMYRTGDLARWTPDGKMQFLGRGDHQVKVQGYRVELGEIESSLSDHAEIKSVVVTVVQSQAVAEKRTTKMCAQCGLPDNYPGITFDAAGVCNVCRDFNVLRDRFRPYFKTPDDLQRMLEAAKRDKTGKYDCMILFSGGKDSTYMLYKLVKEYGMTPLVFNLDNGYISEEAKTNMRTVADALGVDIIFGQTPHMNAVFVDSLHRHNNVCNGCFKVLYTLSINLAREKGIKYIFTGLSRGQLFETRLSDMFQARIFDVEEIDRTILAARKAYHRIDDAVTQLMDVKIFEDNKVFDEIQLVDFYRYVDVPLHEVYQYLDQNGWVRPSDTGRSTNCLINVVGIYMHKKARGYHNYALPYSWDVRMGHKTRQEALDELDDDIAEKNVRQILAEIGYDESETQRTRLTAYYTASRPIGAAELRKHLENSLPSYMVPTYFVQLDEMPLTQNGKIDRQALPRPEQQRLTVDASFVAPVTPVELQLAEIWSSVLGLQQVGIHDNFFELGGDSISTIHVMMRVSQAFQINIPPVELFEIPTVNQLAQRIENILISEIEQLSDEEAQSLLSGNDLERSE